MDPKYDLEQRLKNKYSRLKSKGERQIAATLDEYQIRYIYEPNLRLNDHGKQKLLRPDFYLPDQDLIVEYFGRTGNNDYDQRTQKKLTLYQQNGIDILAIYPWDLHLDWPNHLLDKVYFGTPPKPDFSNTRTPYDRPADARPKQTNQRPVETSYPRNPPSNYQ